MMIVSVKYMRKSNSIISYRYVIKDANFLCFDTYQQYNQTVQGGIFYVCLDVYG